MTRPDSLDHPWRATYRVQLTADFGFAEATEIVDYVAALGASHLYLSPILSSMAGSTHGYDGTDPTTVSVERGGEGGLRHLADVAHAAGLGMLVDIVPNHLAASDETPWWVDEDMRHQVFDTDRESGWYRRFFDIDGLAGVRQEDPEVFDLTHTKILELVADGVIDGLRIDHPDGLTDPAGYLQRLHDAAGVLIWVEKILHPGEALRPWPVAGTVGYEFADDATAVFVDPAGESVLTTAYQDLTGDRSVFDEVALAAKRQQVAGPFARELDRLTDLAPDIDRDIIADSITRFPIYRTYVEPATGLVAEADRDAVRISGAASRLAARLLLDEPGHVELVTRFQQTTSPVMAKGVEDTAFYQSVRLLARNEVGTEPSQFSLPIDEFHAHNQRRAQRTPLGLLAATTHDTKRSADVRARIGALPAMADEFDEHVRRWFARAEAIAPAAAGDGGATANQGGDGPMALERWFILQTLVGAWPITLDRMDDYLIKAMREAKLMTQWVDPDEDHEQAVLGFVRRLVEDRAFMADFEPFAERVAAAGRQASIGQTLLRVTSPGVCDIYQGDESWFLALVDPDNRRPVDVGDLRTQLDEVRDGRPLRPETAKLHVLFHSLALRSRCPEFFDPGSTYLPLDAGPNTIVFIRGESSNAHQVASGASPLSGGGALIVVPVRADLHATLALPPGPWVDALGATSSVPAGAESTLGATSGSGFEAGTEEVQVADLLGPLGVGLWERP